jgi:microcystin-dependent protein
MASPFYGEIRMFGGNFAPRGFAFCDGQLLAISQNTALFSILGTTYGGNGTTNFALPDLRGRVAIQQGAGPGLRRYSLGESAGSEGITLTQGQLPAHNHIAGCNTGKGNSSTPVGKIWAKDKSGLSAAYSTVTDNGQMSPQALQTSGGSQPHNNMQPFLTLNFIISLSGIFPSRS